MLAARKRGAAINPQLQRSEQDVDGKPVYMRHNPREERPADKTDQQLRDWSLAGDYDLKAGMAHTSMRHSCQQTGIIASHVLMKLDYWDDAACPTPCTPQLVK